MSFRGDSDLDQPDAATRGDDPHPDDQLAYQRIVQEICRAEDKKGPVVVMVVSASHGEGTSTVARVLARQLSRIGATALVEANLRSPSLLAERGMNNRRSGSWRAVLERATDLDEAAPPANGDEEETSTALQVDVKGSLTVVPVGSALLDSADELDNEQLTSAVEPLRDERRFVVIDAPPATRYPEVAAIANISDQALLVVEAERTRWQVVEQAKDNLERAGVHILGVILNRRRYYIPDWLYHRL